jgi:hypothetical protein
MRRREFLAGLLVALVTPYARAGEPPHIVVLHSDSRTSHRFIDYSKHFMILATRMARRQPSISSLGKETQVG